MHEPCSHNTWRSNITLSTKTRFYTVYIIPVLLYDLRHGLTQALTRKVDIFDNLNCWSMASPLKPCSYRPIRLNSTEASNLLLRHLQK